MKGREIVSVRLNVLRLGLVVLMAGLAGWGFTVPAEAHATYRASDPAKDESVSTPPTEVWVEFTEQPSDGSSLSIFDPCGERVDSGSYEISVVPGQNRITTSMAAERAGTYQVTWSVLSNQDGHPTSGSYTFSSTGGSACEGDGGEDPESPEGARDPRSSGGGQPATSDDTETDGPAAGTRGKRQRDPEADARRDRSKTPVEEELDVIDVVDGDLPSVKAQSATSTADISVGSIVAAIAISFSIGAGGGLIYRNLTRPPR